MKIFTPFHFSPYYVLSCQPVTDDRKTYGMRVLSYYTLYCIDRDTDYRMSQGRAGSLPLNKVTPQVTGAVVHDARRPPHVVQ